MRAEFDRKSALAFSSWVKYPTAPSLARSAHIQHRQNAIEDYMYT